jgi:hypothetical protein
MLNSRLGIGLLLIGVLNSCSNNQAKPGDEVSVTCHGQEWVRCFRQVDKRCGSGRYQLLSQLTDEGSSALGNNESLIRGTFIQRTLVARCTDGKNSIDQ